jgi:predicted secreted Zn-dependent protease
MASMNSPWRWMRRTPTLLLIPAVFLLLLAGCLSAPEPEPKPTPDIEATVPARVTQKLASQATVEEKTDETPSNITRGSVRVRLTTSVEAVYYEVRGFTVEEIMDSVKANIPQRKEILEEYPDGKFVGGFVASRPHMKWEMMEDFSCRIKSVELHTDFIVHLPMHANLADLSPTPSERVEVWMEKVKAHEQKHVDIYLEGMNSLQSAIRRLPWVARDCDTLGTGIEQLTKTQALIDKEQQEEFHRTEAAEIKRRVQPLRDKLAELERRYEQFDAERDLDESRIAEVEIQQKPISGKIADIKPTYPSGVPSTIYQDYLGYVAEYNRLNELHNSFVGEHNRLGTLMNELTSEMNRLIEEIKWQSW